MITRVLYCQSERATLDDYFVVNGLLAKNDNSDLVDNAFQLIKSTDEWNVLYEDSDLILKKCNAYFSIESHYVDKDDLGRFMSFIFYSKSEEVGTMLDFLKKDSTLINKVVAFDSDKLIKKIESSKELNKVLIRFGIGATILTLLYILWK